MILLDAAGLGAYRPDRPLFENLSLTVSSGDRLAVVGRNGTGKSTLIRLLAGLEAPEEGELRRGSSVAVSVLDQRVTLPEGRVADAVASGWRAAAALDRLGLTPMADAPVSTLSGGQRTRLGLARALAAHEGAEHELLLLDEPTNHLDLDIVAWLHDELRSHRGGVVMVSHDRWLIDGVATRILEIDEGRGHVHEGGYADWLEARSERLAHQARADEVRRNLARQELEWLRRGAAARRRKPRSRLAEAAAVIEASSPEDPRAAGLDLDRFGARRLGNQIIELAGVSFAHPGRPPLFEGVDLMLAPDERLGIVGPNGSGKSTLLGLLAGRHEPTGGRLTRGVTVHTAELDQHGAWLDPDQRVIEAVAGGNTPDHRHAALLDSFWFDRDARFAPVGTLSGGERRRLQLLLVLAAEANVVLLDEPTNDLDLDTVRALEDHLVQRPGAVVMVSHDRALLERVCDRIVAVEHGLVAEVPRAMAGLDEWRRRHTVPSGQVRPAASPSRPAASPSRSRPSPAHLRKQLRQLGREIDELAEFRRQLEVRLGVTSDHDELSEIAQELARVGERAEQAEERWLELATQAEEAGLDPGL